MHFIHFVFGLDTLFQVLTLLVVAYQNFKKRKFWMGDAFVSVTSTIGLRTVLVLLSWYMNKAWRLLEFCLVEANVMGPSSAFTLTKASSRLIA